MAFGSRVTHSQTTRTRHPPDRNARSFLASLFMLASIFARQNLRLPEGHLKYLQP